MKIEADEEQIDEILKSKLQEAYSEMLEEHGIKSGDITPFRQMEMDEAEDELSKLAYEWIKSRVEQDVRPISDKDFIGKKVFIQAGEYERTDYLDAGGSHSEEYFEINQPTKGMIVEEVYEGKTFCNVAVTSENHQRMFLLVPNKKIEIED